MQVAHPTWLELFPGMVACSKSSSARRIVVAVLAVLSVASAALAFALLPRWQLAQAAGFNRNAQSESWCGPSNLAEVEMWTALPSILPWHKATARTYRAEAAECALIDATSRHPSSHNRDIAAAAVVRDRYSLLRGDAERLLASAGAYDAVLALERTERTPTWETFQAARVLGQVDSSLRLALEGSVRGPWEAIRAGAWLCLHGKTHAGTVMLDEALKVNSTDVRGRYQANWALAACTGGSEPMQQLTPDHMLSVDPYLAVGASCEPFVAASYPLVLASNVIPHPPGPEGRAPLLIKNQVWARCLDRARTDNLFFTSSTLSRTLFSHAFPAEWVESAAMALEARARDSMQDQVLGASCGLWVQAGMQWLVRGDPPRALHAAEQAQRCSDSLGSKDYVDALASLWLSAGRPLQAASLWSQAILDSDSTRLSPDRHVYLALSQLEAGRPREAVDTVRSAREKKMESIEDALAWLELSAFLRGGFGPSVGCSALTLRQFSPQDRICTAYELAPSEQPQARAELRIANIEERPELLPVILHAVSRVGGDDPEVFVGFRVVATQSDHLADMMRARATAAAWRSDTRSAELWEGRVRTVSAPVRGHRSAVLAYLSGL